MNLLRKLWTVFWKPNARDNTTHTIEIGTYTLVSQHSAEDVNHQNLQMHAKTVLRGMVPDPNSLLLIPKTDARVENGS